jgi:Flp pilus assembly secretin CpaC
VMLRAGEIAQATSAKFKVINLLQLPGGMDSQQVMLQVRFAEVNRSAVRQLGVSLFTGPSGYKDYVARATTQQFAAPDFTERIGPPPPAGRRRPARKPASSRSATSSICSCSTASTTSAR